jgi:hypothetical protein
MSKNSLAAVKLMLFVKLCQGGLNSGKMHGQGGV